MSDATRGPWAIVALLAVCLAATGCGDDSDTDSSGGRAADAAAESSSRGDAVDPRELTRQQVHQRVREVRRNVVQEWCDGPELDERHPLSEWNQGEILYLCGLADGGSPADVREAGYEICVALLDEYAPEDSRHYVTGLNSCRPTRNDRPPRTRRQGSDGFAVQAIATCKRGIAAMSLSPRHTSQFEHVCEQSIVSDLRAEIRNALATLCVNVTSIDFPPGPSPTRNRAMAECLRHVSGRSAQARP